MRGRTLQTLDKALQVLQTVAAPPRAWGVSEIARQLGLPRSVVHSILTTLRLRGFVEQDPRTRLYRLGPAILGLAGTFGPADLREVAQGPLQVLAHATGESAYLFVPSGLTCVTIARAEAPGAVRVTSEVGSFWPLYAGSNPKAILAFMPPDRIRRCLEEPLVPMAANTPADAETVLRHLEQIRAQGYAYTEEEMFDGIAGVAAPIFNRHGEVVGSVGIGGMVARVRANKETIIARVLAAARAISAALGHIPPAGNDGHAS